MEYEDEDEFHYNIEDEKEKEIWTTLKGNPREFYFDYDNDCVGPGDGIHFKQQKVLKDGVVY